ncbi:MAG: hypothetical protein V4555_14855 [Acidobacteriota bacterium]
MQWFTGLALGMVLLGGQTATETPLTEDGLRAWLVNGGAVEANRKLIHEQFAVQRAKLPAWWPAAVADQEEEAMQAIDMAHVALPFYQPCMTDPEARLLAKMALTKAGKRVSTAAMDAHSKEMEGGMSATNAQQAGEDAAAAARRKLSRQETRDTAAAFTPSENAYASKHFTPARVAVFKKCTDQAFAQLSGEVGKLELAAINDVIEKNRPLLVEAKTAWVKTHPEDAQ